ncbi:hypothetical protein IFM89_001300 [Coptis chinensis]|uniref:WIYLD domain-containing protein n=1 Tax=Coptis chinensis TaxID=261450 RepID=A0A835M8N0_9MAGN|nr:hypothetical protein IFM89_001300 [Coptis chinensis]
MEEFALPSKTRTKDGVVMVQAGYDCPGMAEVPRHKKAFIAMRALGVDDKTTETILKNLLKVYKNWEPIEEENYRVLADVIFEDGKNQWRKQGRGRNRVLVIMSVNRRN